MTPRSTYRVQLTPAFGFREAAGVADYLAELGVSHLYVSPCLQAAPGSTHGYDVVDHHRVNDELGGAEGHEAMCAALREAGLGQVLDIVPNHMAIGVRANAWWWDVLENGSSSAYASYFDVDWDPPERKLRDTVLLPILPDHYGRVLEAGGIRVVREGGGFVVRVSETELPVAPRSRDELLAEAAARCGTGGGVSLDEAVDAVVAEVNADPDRLDALLDRQHYRLAFWRTAGQELDYRRFFDITSLVGLRVEDEAVFADTHELVLRWLRESAVDGLRVDHPDGLRDPAAYLDRLAGAAGGAWVVVEKILEPGERLPLWPVAGTTGYDFLNRVGGLFVDPAGEAPLTELYAELTGEKSDWGELTVQCKHQVMREALATDISRLTALFVQVCEGHRRYRDYTRLELADALREVIAGFSVYRTYVRAEAGEVSAEDEARVGAAVAAARRRRPDIDADLLDFLGAVLTLRVPAPAGSPEAELVMRFQQVTSPVMAKAVEDTAFYRYNRLVALNEVGGDPSAFGVAARDFHRACMAAAADRPAAMLASSTHDTKRSEDVRARLALLSEIPEEWGAFARRWLDDGPVDRDDQYLFLQTGVGAWPLPAPRAAAYMEKATKEAKRRTSWTDPDPQYDDAVRRLAETRLGDRAFLDDVEGFVAPLVGPGRVNSLAGALVKLTAPGVPDTYQGTELWDLSLVDPDNRRPVDFALRRRLLRELPGLSVEEVMARSDEGLPKLLVTTRALHAGVGGDYAPLAASGPASEHVVAFARGGRHVTVAPRQPPGQWRDLLTGDSVAGQQVRVADLLGRLPVALLCRESDAQRRFRDKET